jgi:hypothetical protein
MLTSVLTKPEIESVVRRLGSIIRLYQQWIHSAYLAALNARGSTYDFSTKRRGSFGS